MAGRIEWQGKDYGPQVADITAGEVLFIEREIGIDTEHWSTLVQMMAEAFVTIRRKDPDAITWADVEAMSVESLTDMFLDDTPARKAPADRKPRKQTAAQLAAARKASTDPLAGGAAASAARKTARRGARAAGAGSRNASPGTSST